MILTVESADYLSDYRLRLRFNTGMERVVDLSAYLTGEVFEPLKDKQYFKQFFIDCNTVSWKNGADVAPEFLFLISQPVFEPETIAEQQFMQHIKQLYQN